MKGKRLRSMVILATTVALLAISGQAQEGDTSEDNPRAEYVARMTRILTDPILAYEPKMEAVQNLADLGADAEAAVPALEAWKEDCEPSRSNLNWEYLTKYCKWEVELALKRIYNPPDYPKLTDSNNFQILSVERKRKSGNMVPRQPNHVFVFIHFNTDDPSFTGKALMRGAAHDLCGVLRSGSGDEWKPDGGGGDLNDPSGEKICGFVVPNKAEGFSFQPKNHPAVELGF